MYVGLDIGSYQTKLCYCGDGAAETVAWPTDSVELRRAVSSPAAGARPQLDDLGSAAHISVDSVPYVVRTTSEFADRRTAVCLLRSARLREYRAVALAALARVPSARIDSLVLALPFPPFIGPPLRSALACKLRGEHKVGERTLQISRVRVVPQGFGTFVQLTHTLERATSVDDTTLVVDVGYRYVSWLLVQDEWQHTQGAGASPDGVSFIQGAVGRELCGRACARPMDRKSLCAVPLTYMDYMSLGTNELTALVTRVHVAAAVRRVKDSLPDPDAVTCVMLAGGGASHYEKELWPAFPHACKVTCASPVLVNVVGLQRLASNAGNQ